MSHLINLHWLPIPARIKFKAIMFTYRTTTGSAPLYLNPLLQTYVPSRNLCSESEHALLCHPTIFSSGSQRRRSLSLPVLTLIFPALLPCLVRDSLCTALQTKILWINWSLNANDTIETWVSGNLTALTERSQPAIQWRVGEVANRVSGGSFRGGH